MNSFPGNYAYIIIVKILIWIGPKLRNWRQIKRVHGEDGDGGGQAAMQRQLTRNSRHSEADPERVVCLAGGAERCRLWTGG